MWWLRGGDSDGWGTDGGSGDRRVDKWGCTKGKPAGLADGWSGYVKVAERVLICLAPQISLDSESGCVDFLPTE